MAAAPLPGVEQGDMQDPPDLTRSDICRIIASYVPLRYAHGDDAAKPVFNFRGFRLQRLDLAGLLLQGDFDCADLRGSNFKVSELTPARWQRAMFLHAGVRHGETLCPQCFTA